VGGAVVTRDELIDELRAGPDHDSEKTHRLMLLAADMLANPDLVADVGLFHEKYKLAYLGPPRVLPLELAEFRRKFLREEIDEYEKSSFAAQQALAVRGLFQGDLVSNELAGMLDALVDEVYVAIGTAQLHGFDFREAWRRVQAANMVKVRAERASDSKRGTTYDVVKPPGWTAPDHTDLVQEHAHRR
jgi:predicted HAD superfamily Cof-like phosphohydrolase